MDNIEYMNTEEFGKEVEEVVLGRDCDNIISENLYELFNHELGNEVRKVMGEKYGTDFVDDMVNASASEVEDAIAAAFIKWLKKYNYIPKN